MYKYDMQYTYRAIELKQIVFNFSRKNDTQTNNIVYSVQIMFCRQHKKKVHSWFFHLFFFVKFCFYLGMYYLQIYDNYTAIQSCYTMRGLTYIKDRTMRGLAKNALDDSQKLCNIHIAQKLKILSNSVLSKINQHIQSLKYSNFAVKKSR